VALNAALAGHTLATFTRCVLCGCWFFASCHSLRYPLRVCAWLAFPAVFCRVLPNRPL
jgi:hypothetical protein